MIETQLKPTMTPESLRPAGHLLVDSEIREYVKRYQMLEPFEEQLKRDGVISYGLSSMGYDIRVTDEFKIFDEIASAACFTGSAARCAYRAVV